MFYKNAIHQKGFGLIEVLVAIIVLAVGLLALMSFQTEALRSSSDARNRTIATNLAEDRMEQLRAEEFDNIIDDTETVTGTTVNANTPFIVNWTQTQTGAGNAEHKEVAVQVQWTDEAGDTQQVTLTSIINSSLPTDPGRTNTGDLSGLSGPKVPYTPGAVPDVVSIDFSTNPSAPTGKLQEATTPTPEINDQSGTTQVSFEEVTYETNNSGSNIISRDENLTINCICKLGRSDSQIGLSPATLDVGEDTSIIGDEKWVQGSEIAGKTVGRVATGNTNVNGTSFNLTKQPELCDICCRDHHDGGTNNDTYYDPFRHTGSGDHAHYFYDINNALAIANSTDNLYLEACRYVRVDGFWRVVQDWRLEGLQVLPEDFLTDANNLEIYREYLRQFIKEYILSIDINGIGTSSGYPSAPPDVGNFTATADTDFIIALEALPNAGESGDEVSMTIGNTKQLISRGLFIDYMDSELINRLKCKINGSGSNCTDIAVTEDYLAEVPFHEVNLTYLANWQPGLTAIDMKSEPIELTNSGTPIYDRGLVTALQNGNDLAKVVIERSNSGVVDGNIIDNNTGQPNPDSLTMDDSLDIVVGSGGTLLTYTMSGTIIINSNAGFGVELQNSDIVVSTPTTDATCGVTGSDANGNPTYSCSLPTTASSIDISISHYNFNQDCTPTDNTDNIFAVFNNKVAKNGGEIPSSSTVTSGGTTGESTTFTYSFSDTSVNYTADFKITKDGAGSGC